MADCQTIDVTDIAGVGSSQASEATGDNEFEAGIWGRLYALGSAYSKVDSLNHGTSMVFVLTLCIIQYSMHSCLPLSYPW